MALRDRWLAQDKEGTVTMFLTEPPSLDEEKGEWFVEGTSLVRILKGKPNENWQDTLVDMEKDSFSINEGILEKGSVTDVKLPYPQRAVGVLLRHPLFPVLMAAIHQAAFGKGERHGGSKLPFLEQAWVGLADRHGRGFLSGQCEKKSGEAPSKPPEAFRVEMLGAIVYAGMSIIYEEQLKNRGDSNG